MTVIEVDGVPVQPYTVDGFTINVAQRYSVLIQANQNSPTNTFWIRYSMFVMAPWIAADVPPGLNPNPKAILRYSDANPAQLQALADSFQSPTDAYTIPNSQPNPNPVMLRDTSLTPAELQLPPSLGPNDVDVTFNFQFETRPGDTYQKAYPNITVRSPGLPYGNPQPGYGAPVPNGNINTNGYTIGTSYVVPREPTQLSIAQGIPIQNLPPTSNVVPLRSGQVVQITVINQDGGEHPFHLHGHVFWVMASGTAKRRADIPTAFDLTRNLLRRDVLTVDGCPSNADGCLPATDGNGSQFGYTVIRFVADNWGVWMFHCHIEWHIAAGLVMQFAEGPEFIAAKGPAAITKDTCDRFNAFSRPPNTYTSAISTNPFPGSTYTSAYSTIPIRSTNPYPGSTSTSAYSSLPYRSSPNPFPPNTYNSGYASLPNRVSNTYLPPAPSGSVYYPPISPPLSTGYIRISSAEKTRSSVYTVLMMFTLSVMTLIYFALC
jgi:iron transport multicopper oxidase